MCLYFAVTPDSVQGQIMVTDHWQMLGLKGKCVDYMERQIDTENALGKNQYKLSLIEINQQDLY